MKLESKKAQLIYWASLCNQKGLVSARSGNISCEKDSRHIYITSRNAYLGHLEDDEVLCLNLNGERVEGNKEPTSETLIHTSIHKALSETQVVIHAHSPFSTAFFHYHDRLELFSFEAKFYLGTLPVIPQETPTVTDVAPVIEALKKSNIIVLKNHGIIATGCDFKEAFGLLELLEEQTKVALTLKGLSVRPVPVVSAKEQRVSVETKKRYRLLSQEHMDRLVEVVNGDSEVQELGKKYNLTCTLAIKNQDTNDTVCFYYEKGKIVKVDNSEQAEFVITGRSDMLKRVFNREIDPFVASTQGKVKTKGDFAKMSKWYPVLVRTFALWEQAPVT